MVKHIKNTTETRHISVVPKFMYGGALGPSEQPGDVLNFGGILGTTWHLVDNVSLTGLRQFTVSTSLLCLPFSDLMYL